MTGGRLPTGFVRVTTGRRSAVTLESLAEDAERLLAMGTLYDAASRIIPARRLAGRGIAYAVSLPVSREPVVVRHNRHGGFFAPVTRDLFTPPSRAPYELDMSRRLDEVGVPTVNVVMYGLTPAGIFCRADVVTREIEGGRDLASYMRIGEPAAQRTNAWRATAILLDQLASAGARHHDLNVKNVLLVERGGTWVAYLLDVDRVVFGRAHSETVRNGNLQRLLRSARKWRDERGAEFDERDLRR